ncbi:MAG TPA: hypothetical protein VKC89_01285 [Patescibacteria group bacterium]|nr:hypothetical protein [Patescibacteria group bacterium]
MKERTVFSEVHDRILESGVQDSRFWAKGILDLNVPRKYKNVLERETYSEDASQYNTQAICLIGYDGKRLKSLLVPANFEGSREELSAIFTDRFTDLGRSFYVGPLEAFEERAYALARTQNIKVLAALILVKFNEEEKQRIHLQYPDIFDSIAPGIGPGLALHFVVKTWNLQKMN